MKYPDVDRWPHPPKPYTFDPDTGAGGKKPIGCDTIHSELFNYDPIGGV